MSDDYEEVTGEVIAVTDNAVFVNNGQEQTWIPWSLVDEEDRSTYEYVERGEEITINVQGWFARQEDLA